MINKIFTKNKVLISSFLWRAIQVFGKQGLVFVIFLICVQKLSQTEFGVYNYILALVNVVILFGDFGISTATSRFVAEYNIVDKESLKHVIFNVGLLLFIVTAVLFIIILIFGKELYGENYEYILLLLPLVFLIPATSVYDGVYRGLKKFRKLSLISVLVGIISIIAVYLLVGSYGLKGAFLSQDIFYGLSVLCLAIGYRELHFKLNKKVVKDIVNYSLIFGLASLGYYLFSEIDTVILGHYNYIKEIATYQVIDKLFIASLLPMTILGQVIGPNFTELSALNKLRELFAKYKKYLTNLLILSLIYLLTAIIGVPLLVRLFFPLYNTSILYEIIFPVSVAYAISFYGVVINGGIIVPTGYANLMVKQNFIIGITNISLALVLNKIVGYTGILYGNMISTIIGSSLLNYQYFSAMRELSRLQKANYKVSIIMPVFNAEKYLSAAIESILNQTYANFELIIIDDCSTDKSKEIIEKYLKDVRLKLISNPTNMGNAMTRNVGLAHATGDFVAVMDADDVSKRNRLQKQLAFMIKYPNCGLTFTNAMNIDEQDKALSFHKAPRKMDEIVTKLPRSNFIHHSSVMWRRELGLTYREKFTYSQDYDLYLRVLSRGIKIGLIPQYLILYRINTQSVSRLKASVQGYYSQLAQAFYFERLASGGKDSYDKTDFAVSSDDVPDSVVTTTDINKALATINSVELRKALNKYHQEKGFLTTKYRLYYLASMLPRTLLRILILGKTWLV